MTTPTSLRRLVIACSFVANLVLCPNIKADEHMSPHNGDHQTMLLKHPAFILSMDPDLGKGPLGLIEGGDLLVEDGTIRAVGRTPDAPHATVIDATGLILMPGFVDVHNHLYQSVIRGACADQDLLGWLERCAYPSTRAFSAQAVYDATRLSTLGLIDTGVTTVVDWVPMAFTPEVATANLRALTDSGLRFAFGYSPKDAEKETVQDLKSKWIDPNPLARLQLSGATYSAFEEHLAKIVRLAGELDIAVNVHLLEHPRQRDDDPFSILERTGALALGSNLLVNHAIHVLPGEITRLAQHGVRVAHCPLSNMRLGSGIMHLPEFHDAGVRVGLGLDGGTNDTTDFFNLMRAAVGLQRARAQTTTVYPHIADVLRMATIEGAAILGLNSIIGSLSPGKRADLIAIDPRGVNFAPTVDVASQLVLNAQPANVRYVMVDGKLLKDGNRFVGVDPAPLIDSAQRTADRLRQMNNPSE
ncbi:N-ethylammeline chlorohydrolase [Nitrospira sp.]|nr:N-ethylammeline chlorohydrolase [Nitrospira sp.]